MLTRTTRGRGQAPLTVQVNSPLEVVHQFFVKLGARYVVVLDADGYCESSFSFFSARCARGIWTLMAWGADEGVIDKKTWLAFLGEIEERSA